MGTCSQRLPTTPAAEKNRVVEERADGGFQINSSQIYPSPRPFRAKKLPDYHIYEENRNRFDRAAALSDEADAEGVEEAEVATVPASA